MSDALFDLDPVASREQEQRIQSNVRDVPADLPLFEGIGKSVVQAPFRGLYQATKAVGILATGAVNALDKFPQHDDAMDERFAAIDKYLNPAINDMTPNADETGKASKIVGDVIGSLAPLALGPEVGLPTMLSSSQQQTSTGLMEQGASPGASLAAGTAATLANAAGFKIPFLGSSLLSRTLSGAAGNVAVGAGSQAAIHEILKQSGNVGLADQFNWHDPEQVAIDTLMGLAFGGFAHATSPKLTTAQSDAVLTLRNAKKFQQDSAPGVPVDAASSAKHQAAMETAITQLMNDQPVEIADQIEGAQFHELTPDSARTRAINAAHHEVYGPDIEALAVSPELKASLGDVYQKAAEVKPVFDQAVRDVAEQIGTPHEPLIPPTLKGVDRAAEKVAADYGGDAGKLKDVVRGSIVIDSLDQAHQAIDLLKQRFGEFTKYRNTLDHTVDTLDGYRDINTNVMVNGHVSELQINFPEMLKAKASMHGLYEERRQVSAKDHPTKQELVRVDELNQTMKARYDKAWADILSRSNSAKDIKVPSSMAQDNLAGRPAGESKARTTAPPLPSGKAETGTPSTSQKTGSLPNLGISAPPTGKSVAQGTEAALQRDIMTAQKLVTETPDAMVATGFDADNNPVYRRAADVMAEIDEAHAVAKKEASVYDVAANCFLSRGS